MASLRSGEPVQISRKAMSFSKVVVVTGTYRENTVSSEMFQRTKVLHVYSTFYRKTVVCRCKPLVSMYNK